MLTRIKYREAFTIVELLIVVAVIAILAAISTIAYQGAQNRAREASLKSDLSQAAKQLGVDKVLTGAYPGSVSLANGGDGLKAADGTSYQYTVNNSSGGANFCLSAVSGSRGYYVTESTVPQEGVCTGHSAPGDANMAVTCSSYSVGDTGPAGGKIFYKDTSTTPSKCYEAAPAGWYAATAPNDPRAEFGCYMIDAPGAAGIVIGTGRQNTADVRAANCLAATGGNLVAATIAGNYSGGAKTDWHLPSIDELSQIYAQRSGVGGLASGEYVSSTEYSDTRTRFVNFVTGSRAISNKDTLRYVRPIRSFSE